MTVESVKNFQEGGFTDVCGRISILFLPALVVHPQVVTLERQRTDDVGARVVGRAVAPDSVRCRRLAPLGPVQGGRQRKRFRFETDVVQAA